ncbi:MAG: MATE family efflux transporter [Marinosulfonomonas sp.]|nr:MATE family efflux transporter [Marinosulfonomonas sp.]
MTKPVVGPLTHGRVLKIAVPIVLSNATVPILGAVDTGVVGQLGLAAPIGAVGIGAIILSAIYWIFGFLRMGTTGLVAQAKGAGDESETGALLMRALMIGLAAGVFFVLAQGAVFWGAFQLAPASQEVEGLARQYLTIRIWGAPATIALFAVTGWLIATERTKGVLILQLWMNSLNILLDLWFVLSLGWGVEGVAIATLIAEWTGLALGLWLCRAAFWGDKWHDWARIFDREKIRRMMSVNGDIMVRSIILQGSFVAFLFLGARFGDVTLAANQVILQFLEITAFALDGFAFAAEALVGAALGAGRRPDLRRAAIITSQWGVGISIPISVFFFLAGPWLIDLMTTSPDVRLEAKTYLVWVAMAPLIGIGSWMLDGIFIGATRTRDMRHAMVISGLTYLVAVVVLIGPLENHGLWLALMILNVTRALTLGWFYPALEASADAAKPSQD